jgi:hypothetical protein
MVLTGSGLKVREKEKGNFEPVNGCYRLIVFEKFSVYLQKNNLSII